MNKRGFGTFLTLTLAVFTIFLFVVFMGILTWSYFIVNDVLDTDIDIGQVNLEDINNESFGAIADAFLEKADYIALSVIFGVVIFLLLNSYFFGSRFKLLIIIDVAILIVSIVISVYLSNFYYILINSSDFLSFYKDYLPDTSKLLLNLHYLVGTVGFLMMILQYATRKKDFMEGSTGGDLDVIGY